MRIFTWQMAEELAQGHMQELGFDDSRRTAVGADDGIDVASRQAIAQVKHQSQPVGSPAIQRLRGAAFNVDHALFYSSSGYTEAARSFADSRSVALFVFDVSGDVVPANSVATDLESQNSNRANQTYRQKQSLLLQSSAIFGALGAMSLHAVRHLRTEVTSMENDIASISDTSTDAEIRAVSALLLPRTTALDQFRLRRAALMTQFEAIQMELVKVVALGTDVPMDNLYEILRSLTTQHASWATLLNLDDAAISKLVKELEKRI